MFMAQENHGARGGLRADILPPLHAPSRADEAHHRICNSLQLLCAAISLEARDIADDAARSALARMQRRIGAIAGVHRQLYRANARGDVDLGAYLEELGLNLARTCPPERRVLVSAMAISVASENAAAIGMIVTELATNACKHAYPAGSPGDVLIRLQKLPGGYLVWVEDSGRGLPATPAIEGLGHRLIDSLAKQIHATYAWGSPQTGTRFELYCPA